MSPSAILKTFLGVAVTLLVLSLGLGSFYVVDQGERGVVLRNGAISSVTDPGLRWKTPFIDTVEMISVQEHSLELANEPAYSSDRQSADITMSINYSAVPSEVGVIYGRYGSLEGLITREITRVAKDQMKNVFGRYTAATAVADREKMGKDILAAISGAGDGLVTIQSIQIENIDFSDAVETALENRSKAEADVQTKKQELEKEKINAQIAVTTAQGIADSTVAAAKAQAEATTLAGNAEASAIRAKGDALRANPDLVALVAAENWNGVLPTTMLPGGTVPFIDIAK